MAAYRDTDIVIRTFCVPVRRTVRTQDEYDRVDAYQRGLEDEVNSFLQDEAIMTQAMSLDIKSKGRFETGFNRLSHNRYKDKDYALSGGNQAKSFKFVEGNIRQVLVSQAERRQIAGILAAHDYDISTAEKLSAVYDDLRAANLYPTIYQLRNIVSSNGAVSLPRTKRCVIDWAVQDNQPIKTSYDDGYLSFTCDYRGRWIEHRVLVPDTLKNPTGAFSKPCIYRAKSGELMMSVPYDAYVNEDYINSLEDTHKCLGIDLGVIRPFAGSVIDSENNWVTGLAPSKELERLCEKFKRLDDDVRGTADKYRKYEALACRDSDDEFIWRMYDLGKKLEAKRMKRSLLREHIEWVFARDIVNHALENKCGMITFEDFRPLDTITGWWDVASIVRHVTMDAELHGIQVWLVNIKDTSHTNPFTGEHVEPAPKTRLVEVAHGVLMDRDDVASLEIAWRQESRRRDRSEGRRKPKSRRRAGNRKRPSLGKRKRYVVRRRPRSKSRTRLHKESLVALRSRKYGARHASHNISMSASSVSVVMSAGVERLGDSILPSVKATPFRTVENQYGNTSHNCDTTNKTRLITSITN